MILNHKKGVMKTNIHKDLMFMVACKSDKFDDLWIHIPNTKYDKAFGI